MKNFFHIIITGMATGAIAFLGFLPTVRAEAIITEGYLQNDTVWDKTHSPYILNDTVTVPSGMTLTIEPGVEIQTDPASEYSPYIYVAGKLVANGSKDEPIRIGDIWGLTIDHGEANFKNTVFEMKDSLLLSGSQVQIEASTIMNTAGIEMTDGIYIENSKVTIQGSKIENNKNGIVVRDSSGVFQVRKNVGPNLIDVFAKIGLIKTAEAASLPSEVSIIDSSLLNNNRASIFNYSTIEVQAKNNWWGSKDGPQSIPTNLPASSITGALSNGVRGSVVYEPWLDHDPLQIPVVTCCSSILFLPGLEASRLYRPDSGLLGIGSSTNRLWEPNRNDDVRKLFLNPDGTSIDQTVYAGGPLTKALGLKDVYGSFLNFLDDLSTNGKIGEWKSFGYDWRRPIEQVVETATKRATTTESLMETVEQLASRSKTGKVTLIAHSNGGLVAKYLVKKLTDVGKENLIDSVISVAVPYLGTPQALLGLLHGDNQSIFGGLILKQSVAKELGMNMSSAYSLIPSTEYFKKILGPTIAYASGTSTLVMDSATKQDSFVSSRTNSILMNAAEILHGIIDPFSWPTNIARWAIVGWGNKTAKGIVYSDVVSKTKSGAKRLAYNATTTSMGDGTVVTPSAAYNAGTTTAINLQTVSATDDKEIDHSNILGATATQKAIENLVTIDNHNKNAKIIEEELVKIPGVTIGEPDYSQEATFLVVSTHSPVELHVYDKNGNHTGIAPLPSGTDEEIEEGLFTYVEKEIRGSSFEMYGDEEEPEMYISLPDNSGQTYSVSIQGTGVGEFTYKVERIRGGEILDSIAFEGLPATPLMNASTTVSAQIPSVDGQGGGSAIPIKLASSTPALKVDVDGNGSADITMKANTQIDPQVFLESIKKTVIQLIGSTNRSKNIIKRIDHLQELVKKGKLKKIENRAKKLKKVVAHKKAKLLSPAEKEEIIGMIDTFLAQFE